MNLFRVLLLGIVSLFIGCNKPEQRQVVVYTSVDEPIATPILADFQKQTGIRVVVQTDAEATKTAGLAERLRAEKDNPQCDVWWGNEPFFTIGLARDGVLAPYQSPMFKEILPRFRDAGNLWAGNGARVRVIAVNKSCGLKITSLEDLANPELKNKIGMARPTVGTTAGHVASLYVAWGQERADKFFRALRGNGIKLLGGNSVTADGAGKGTLWAGMTDNDDCDAALREGGQLVAVTPPETILLPCTVGIIRNAKHSAEAAQLADYLLSKAVEDRLLAVQFTKYSVRSEPPVKTLDADYAQAGAIMPQVMRRATAILEGTE